MPLVLNGTTGVQDNSGAFVRGTTVASTSGTSIDFTSIPSWVKRITVMFNNVSTNGSSNFLIQLGDSGGIENTGYVSSVISAQATTVSAAQATSTAGHLLNSANDSTYIWNGSCTINNISSLLWIFSSVLTNTTGVRGSLGGSSKELSATLDRVRITTVNGTDTFDAGSINILYE
jgi:hypothetical protein